MKFLRRREATLVLVTGFGLLQACPSFGGPKAYDIGILLGTPHPFTLQSSPPSAPPSMPSPNPPPSSRAPQNALAPPPYPLRRTPIIAPAAAVGSSHGGGRSGGVFDRRKALNALTLFGGNMINNHWIDLFPPDDIEFRGTQIAGLAVSRKIWQIGEHASLAVEGQIVRHFGEQDHWEFNLPVVLRWHTFPWDQYLDTSFAFGLGPSYATKVPVAEVEQDGDSHRFLVYWYGEIEVGLPSSPWSGLFRLHHRSEAFGFIADEGGGNVLVLGLRRQY